MKEKMEHEAENTSGTYNHEVVNNLLTDKDPKEVELTAEKVGTFLVEITLILAGCVAVVALIWGWWTIFKTALTIFIAVIFGIGLGYYLQSTIGKLFK